MKTDELLDVTEWLGELVRQVDSSLIDEWEHLAAAAASTSLEQAVAEVGLELGEAPPPPPVTANTRAFKVMVRNAAFRRVELLARRDVASLAESEMPGGLDATGWSQAVELYYSAHSSLGTGPQARSAELFEVSSSARATWLVRQVLDDPEGWHDTAIIAEVDLAASDESGAPAWRTLGLEQG